MSCILTTWWENYIEMDENECVWKEVLNQSSLNLQETLCYLTVV